MSAAAIRVEKLSKAFNGNRVLEDVSFEVQHGEAFCLLGRSGTGKSVTLKLIIGLLPHDAGKVAIDNEEVQPENRLELMKIRKKIGFLFQNAALFDSISLAENIAFPLRRDSNKSEQEIAEVVHNRLSDVGLENDGDKMPSDLSGGMRKRAGLARALVLDPSILLVDEPSSGLDRITAHEIYDLLGKLKEQKKTLIIVTHDTPGVRKITDRMCMLDKGHVIACGTPRELEQDPNELVRALAAGGGA